MNGYWKTVLTFLAAAVMLVGWGMTWANQSARIHANRAEIGTLKEKMDSVADQTSESEKAIVRMETKIEYIDMPDVLKDKYQYSTEASINKLKKTGVDFDPQPLEESVKDYVQNYLACNRSYY